MATGIFIRRSMNREWSSVQRLERVSPFFRLQTVARLSETWTWLRPGRWSGERILRKGKNITVRARFSRNPVLCVDQPDMALLPSWWHHEEQRGLPQELVDAIIDLLHDDTVSLALCALVSRCWVARSHLHLFRELHVDGSQRRLSSFRRMLESPQSPCNHIQRLHFETCASTTWSKQPRIDAEYLAGILSHLPSVRTLTMKGARFGGNCGYRHAETKRFALDKLTMSSVGSMNYSDATFLEILALFSAIDEVHLVHLGFGYYFPSTSLMPFPEPRVQIRSLALENIEETAQMLQLLRSVVDPRTLRSLSLSCSNVHELQELGEFLLHCGSNITQFELDMCSLIFADSQSPLYPFERQLLIYSISLPRAMDKIRVRCTVLFGITSSCHHSGHQTAAVKHSRVEHRPRRPPHGSSLRRYHYRHLPSSGYERRRYHSRCRLGNIGPCVVATEPPSTCLGLSERCEMG